MKEKSCEIDIGRDYEEEDIINNLKGKYTECIRIKAYCYIVKDGDYYYLMNQPIPKIFSTSDGIKLENILEVNDVKNSIRFRVKKGKVVFTKKERALREIERWAM